MISKYDIGDTVILTGTVSRIVQTPTGKIMYILLEYDRPVMEATILARVADSWKIVEMEGVK